MRTTLNLEKPILDGLKALQKREGKSLGQIASRLLADALARLADEETPEFTWNSAAMGAKVDLSDKDAVYAAMDSP